MGRFFPRLLGAGEGVALALCLLGMPGCSCFQFEYASFEQTPEIQVSKRAMWFTEGSAWTFPPIPVRYELVRDAYTLHLSTAGEPFAVVQVSAEGPGGAELEVRAPDDALWPIAQAVPPGSEGGEISFEVLRHGSVIGSETLAFRVRSRSLACEYDLP